MEIRTIDGRLRASSAFKLIATGHLLGAGIIFVPLFLLAGGLTLLAGTPATVNGEVVNGAAARLVSLMMIVVAPIIVALQAVMIGGAGVLGLWLYEKFRPIRVVTALTTTAGKQPAE